MNKQITEKEKLLMIFSEMSNQLAELELILRNSCSDLRSELIREEEEKLAFSDGRISVLETSYQKREMGWKDESSNYTIGKSSATGLKLELGFQ
jgi:hypothetical protein